MQPPGSTGQVTELAFDLQPVSALFKRGQRIRLTVNCADRNNHQTPKLSPPPVVNLHYGESHPCHVILPVIPRRPAK